MDIIVKNGVLIRRERQEGNRADIWFVHGFGESGLSFREVFESDLYKNFNLYVVDLPGFGVSPFQEERATVQGSTQAVEALIREISLNREVILVGHSLGGVIGTWLCQTLKQQVVAYASIEGNLTKADTFFSSLAAQAESAEKFYQSFCQEIVKKMQEDEVLRRYYASLRFADPRSLIAWGKSGVAATGDCRSGEEFAALPGKKIYFWGDRSTPPMTEKFIHDHALPNRCFSGSGHWPMVDQPKEFYQALGNFINS